MWYQLDTKWGCGGIKVENGIVVEGAPIFRKLISEKITKLQKYYKLTPLSTKKTCEENNTTKARENP